MEFTKELLNEVYRYDKETGKLFYKIDLSRVAKKDMEAGSNNSGYLQTQLLGKMLKVHRIIWKMHYGENPECIDHINHNRSDNRLENLRNVTQKENCMNMSLAKNNKTGIQGVYIEKGDGKPYVASIRVDGKELEKKRFKSMGEAIEHRKYLHDKYEFHDNHGKKIC